MNETPYPSKVPDLRVYAQNRSRFPPEELAKFAGKYVAFSLDGTCILASSTTEEDLEKQLLADGIDPSRIVGSYIPPAGAAILL